MKKSAFVLMILCCSLTAKADPTFSCSDVPTLQSILQQLQSTCGSADDEICKADGYAGDTIEDAIQNCVSAGWNVSTCATSVVGKGGNPRICKADGYAGDTIDNAIANCVSAGWNQATCASSVSCGNNVSSTSWIKGKTSVQKFGKF
jgi:hypothetical protein